MKKMINFLTMIAILTIINGLSAQPMHRPKPPGMDALDLTDEQIGKILDLHLKLEKEVVALKAKLEIFEAELKLELTAEEFDQAKVKNLVEQKGKIFMEIELDNILNQRAVRDLLTPGQRKKFDLQVLKRDMEQPPGPMMPMRPFGARMNFRPPAMDTTHEGSAPQ